jgi:O-acetyl-ADP-ribose deacetylase (regulator of RNase III)
MWFGGIDGVINRAAGSLFHAQAGEAMPLKDGQTVVARNNNHAHDGAFKNVVFVVDDLQQPLHRIIYNGLSAASDARFAKVSLPTIRMGVMLGAVEKSADEAVRRMAAGVREFLMDNPKTSIRNITFVVYNDSHTQSLLDRALKAN